MNGKRIQTLAAALASILVLVYVGYQFYRSTHQAIVTETAMYGSVSDTLQVQAFALREEEVISGTYRGVLSYRVADGSRVSNQGVIADIYASESDAAAQNQLDQLDREIESLQALSKPADFYSANPSNLNAQIYTSIDELLRKTRNNSFSEMAQLKESLQTVLNRKQLITGEVTAEDYQARLLELEEERVKLSASVRSAIATITAPAAGYFISSTDGFEKVVDLSQIETITPAQVRDLLGRDQEAGHSSQVGKVCTDFNWYLVCVISDSNTWRFEEVRTVNLDIPFASTETIPARLIAQNRDPATGDTALVLECSYMDSDIASVRNETVNINVRTYSGVLVSEKALRFCDVTYEEQDETGEWVEKVQKNVKGVYVQSGRQLRFVQIFTEKTVNGYAICKTELNSAEQAALVTDRTIQLYDNVVVEGTDLYDGKPIL